MEALVTTGEFNWDSESTRAVKSYLAQHDWGSPITTSNASAALDYIKLYDTVNCREASLLQFREAFIVTDIGRWLAAHDDQVNVIFPQHFPDMTVDEIMACVDGPETYPEGQVMLRLFLLGFEAGSTVFFPLADSKGY